MSGNLILHEPDTPSLLPKISLVSELSLCRNLFCCYSAKGGSKVLSTKKGKKIYPAFLMGAIAPIFLGPCFYLFIHIKTKLYCLGPVKGILLRCTTPQLKGRQCSPDCSATWWCVPSAAHGTVGRSQSWLHTDAQGQARADPGQGSPPGRGDWKEPGLTFCPQAVSCSPVLTLTSPLSRWCSLKEIEAFDRKCTPFPAHDKLRSPLNHSRGLGMLTWLAHSREGPDSGSFN